MYRYRSNNSFRTKNRGPNGFRGRNSTNKLDHNLFINKSVRLSNQEQNMSSDSSVSFADFDITDKLKENIASRGYIKPTPIQEKSIPTILNGRDLIGMASTGSGKTGAFLITLINKSFMDRNQRSLIIVPTRELAVQIKDEFNIFARGMGLKSAVLIGGANIKRQTYDIQHNPNFVIGTPGRIKDMIERKKLNLKMFQNVVLDEVDRMVDIGFIHDIKFLIDLLPKKRQSLFFSATVDRKTQEILNSFVSDPVTVSVATLNRSEFIHQDIVKISNSESKFETLNKILRQPGFDKVIIFGRTKWSMERLSRNLNELGFHTASIHGNKSQNQRQRALDGFKKNYIQILIATDVASRGLDIPDVTHVINYDAPQTYEDYVHRIGRTGRAGKPGTALTFVE